MTSGMEMRKLMDLLEAQKPTRQQLQARAEVEKKRLRYVDLDKVHRATANLPSNATIVWWKPPGYEHELPIDKSSIELDGNVKDYPDFTDVFIVDAFYADGTPLTHEEILSFSEDNYELAQELAFQRY